MNVVRIIVILFFSKVAYSQILYSGEEQSLNFNFSYPCNSSEVTLRFEFGAPIYSSTSPLQDFEEWIETSIDNLMVKKFRFESHCGLKVWWNPVMRIHAGTYIFFSYDDDGSPPEIASIVLRVAFPPGKASCAPSNEFTDNTGGQWVCLNCTASVGSIPGYVQCLQNGLMMPAIRPATENDQILQQTFLVLTTHPVHCCSSTIDQPKSMCECNDTLWNPSHKEEVINPCQNTLTTLFPSQTITDVTLISTPISNSSTAYTENTSEDNGLYYMSVVTIIVGMAFLFLALILFARSRRGQRAAQAGAISTSLKPPNTHPIIALEMVRLETANKENDFIYSSRHQRSISTVTHSTISSQSG